MDLTSNWSYGKRHFLKPNKRKRVILRANGICEREGCDNLLEPNFEVHHIVPVRFGGTNELNNLAALCKNCHMEISQSQQRDLSWVDSHDKLLFTNPFISSNRKEDIEKKESRILKNFLSDFKFKNRT